MLFFLGHSNSLLFGYSTAGEDPCGGGNKHCEWDSAKWKCQLHCSMPRSFDPTWHLKATSKSWTGFKVLVARSFFSHYPCLFTSYAQKQMHAAELKMQWDECGITKQVRNILSDHRCSVSNLSLSPHLWQGQYSCNDSEAAWPQWIVQKHVVVEPHTSFFLLSSRSGHDGSVQSSSYVNTIVPAEQKQRKETFHHSSLLSRLLLLSYLQRCWSWQQM